MTRRGRPATSPVTELSARIRARQLSPVELTRGLPRPHRGAGRPASTRSSRDPGPRARAGAHRREGDQRAASIAVRCTASPTARRTCSRPRGIPTAWGAAPCRGQMFDARRHRDPQAARGRRRPARQAARWWSSRAASAIASPTPRSAGPAATPGIRRAGPAARRRARAPRSRAGCAAFALGTETWGSILCPSAFCGITGLRPTYGRVSRAGAMACAYTFDKVGPLTRSAADCRLVLQAIAGHDPDDPTSSREPVRPRAARKPLAKLRGALIPSDFTQKGEESEARPAFDHAVAELSAAGPQARGCQAGRNSRPPRWQVC